MPAEEVLTAAATLAAAAEAATGVEVVQEGVQVTVEGTAGAGELRWGTPVVQGAAFVQRPCAPAACIELLAAGATAAEVARRAGPNPNPNPNPTPTPNPNPNPDCNAMQV